MIPRLDGDNEACASFETDWQSIMVGWPPLPSRVAEGNDQVMQMLQFRENVQIVKSKYFSNGRHDFDLVAQLLCRFQAKRRLVTTILSKQAGIDDLFSIFSTDCYFSKQYTPTNLGED